MTRRITLLILSRLGAGDGGRETWLANFLDEIVYQGRDIRIDVIHQQTDDETLLDVPARRVSVGSVRRVARNWRWCPSSVEFLVRLLFARFDIPRGVPIVAVGSFAEAVGALLVTPFRGRRGRIMWLRSIYTREKSAQLPGLSKKLVAAMEKLILQRFGLVIANGEDTASFYRSAGIDSHVIPNAVPLHKWTIPPAASSNALHVAFVGRLAEVKGIFAFLKAAEACHKKAPGQFVFHVAGDGPAREQVEDLCARIGLRYYGQVDNEAVRDIVCESHACVALTFSSPNLGGGGVSNALVEQMAAGRILVAWDNDIFRQVLDSTAGYLVPQGRIDALTDVLLHVAQHREEAQQRADRARQLAMSYSIDRHVNRFFDLLEADRA